MAHFKITKSDGTSYEVECTLTEVKIIVEKEEGSYYELIHPGNSGHGTSGVDY